MPIAIPNSPLTPEEGLGLASVLVGLAVVLRDGGLGLDREPLALGQGLRGLMGAAHRARVQAVELLVREPVRDGLGLGWPPAVLVAGLGWLLVASTALSMADRLAALRR